MTPAVAPPLRDIVLLGGGHAHVQVLKRFGMHPEPGLRLTIVAREPHSPYSGMLPGFVAGHYVWDDIHIDLVRLAAFAGARFIAAEATGLDLANRRIVFGDRPSLRYDVLSINTGGVPGERFASDFVTPVKPIGRFLPVWERLVADGALRRLAIVGSGPGGVELALAIASCFAELGIVLIEASPEILPGFAPAARSRLHKALVGQGITVEAGFQVVEARGEQVVAADGRALGVDHVLWVTGVEAPPWPAAGGLATDAAGFVAVNDCLQSLSHPGVFAAGDVAAIAGAPRPKSGVYAVRQGPALAHNLRAAATGLKLRRYRPQRRALAIVGLGDENAVASRGSHAASGRWGVALQAMDRPALHGQVQQPASDGVAAGNAAERFAGGCAGRHALRRLWGQAECRPAAARVEPPCHRDLAGHVARHRRRCRGGAGLALAVSR